MEHAEAEFEKYEENRRRIEATEPTSDFDKMVAEKVNELGPTGNQSLPPTRKQPGKRQKKK
jgi:hypothetical protein